MAGVRYPLIYSFIYYKLRSKKQGEIIISKKDFRLMLSKPIGINRKMAEFILRDFQRYNMIKDISHGKNNKFILQELGNNALLYNDLINMKKVGLL